MSSTPIEATPVCGVVVGPVWKCDGESWICEIPADQPHEWHTAGDMQWVNEAFTPTPNTPKDND